MLLVVRTAPPIGPGSDALISPPDVGHRPGWCEDCKHSGAKFGMPPQVSHAPLGFRFHGWLGRVQWVAASLLICSRVGVQLRAGPGESKRRWCRACAKTHSGAVQTVTQLMCEDCQLIGASLVRGPANYISAQAPHACSFPPSGPRIHGCRRQSLPTDSKLNRWCASCARRGHPGAICRKTRCVDCGLAGRKFGMPAAESSSGRNGKAKKTQPQWCAKCALNHPGAQCLDGKRNCEDCNLVTRWYGIEGQPRPRWCSGCAKSHPGAPRSHCALRPMPCDV